MNAPHWTARAVSLVRHARDVETHPRPVGDLLDGIRAGRWKPTVEKVRAIVATEGRDAAKPTKETLPAVLWSGTFTTRANGNLRQHSGVLCLDFDKLAAGLADARAMIEADPHTAACFVSPSGDGLKVLVLIPAAGDTHRAAFEVAAAHFAGLGLTADTAPRAVASLCFVSYDPHLFTRDDPAPFTVEATPKADEPKPTTPPPAGELTPWADFTKRTTWAAILTPHGWKEGHTKGDGNTEWTRPGKGEGCSATTQGEAGPLYVFSSNAAPFTAGEAVSKSKAFALLNHAGDMTAAARALRAAGYGDQAKPPPKSGNDTDEIRARLWAIAQEKLTTTEAHRKAAAAVVDWLHGRGRFYFHEERRDFAGVLYFDATRKLLLPVQGDAFTAWMADTLSMNRAERAFSFVQAAVETEGLSERATGIQPATYWAATAAACYLSNGPGRMARISAEGVLMVDNGTDGILFPYGSTLGPWSLTDPADPFETCSLFRDMSCTAQHGRLLFKLWACLLPTDQKTKPPLVASGPVGSGKTRVVRGIYELYGMPERIAAVAKNGEGDFWAAVDAGGVACFDNADTRVDWLPDALANAATAGMQEKRKLYTDAGRVCLRARAWVAVTSASPSFAADAGLADRLLVVRLNRRAGETSESALSDEICRHRDAGLSWICWTLADTLADSGPIPAGLNARHPDFARFAVQLGRAMGREDEAVAALQAAEADKGLFNLENDPIGAAVLEVLQAGPFAGTAEALREAVQRVDPSFDGKLSAKRMGKRLGKLWPHLQSVCRATVERDTHTKALTYSMRLPDGFAGFAGFETVFSGKSYAKEYKGTLAETPLETPQTPQAHQPPLAEVLP